MSTRTSSRQLREDIVGRTISGVIARPGRNGEPPVVLMLRFEDGSVVEFVSPRSDGLLRRALRQPAAGPLVRGRVVDQGSLQLSLDGPISAWSGLSSKGARA